MTIPYLIDDAVGEDPVSRASGGLLAESTLVAGLLQGQPWAFSYLYDHYAPTLLGLLRHMVRDAPQAEDLLQDSFIKVYKAISQYDAGKGRFSTWLLRLTRNTALDYIHKQKVRGPYLSLDGCLPLVEQRYFATPSGEESNLEHLIRACLGTKYWILIELIYFQGYTQEQVAQRLQLPLGTVKTRTRTALQRLKTSLGKQQLINHMG